MRTWDAWPLARHRTFIVWLSLACSLLVSCLAPRCVHGATPLISGGLDNSFAVGIDGALRAWGWNLYDRLGIGGGGDSATPVAAGAGMNGITAIAAGNGYTVVLKADGTVWASGSNDVGQLGDGTTVRRSTFVRVLGLSQVVAISARTAHTLALKSDGSVWAWGQNDKGQLGDGSTISRSSPVTVRSITDVASIACGGKHSVAMKRDGTIWTWGASDAGQLGSGSVVDRSTPAALAPFATITAVSAGNDHTLALGADGAVWVWGKNDYGQLGDGTTSNRVAPTRLALSGIAAVAAGSVHSLALKPDGTVLEWGSVDDIHFGSSFTATPATTPGLGSVAAIFAGPRSFAIKRDGTAWGWGSNIFGSLGTGTSSFFDERPPKVVVGLVNVTAIASGTWHGVALTSDGRIWAWGQNYGAFGDEAPFNESAPTPVGGLSAVDALAPGGVHTVALRADGTVWTWGFNSCGQLGDSTPIYTGRPSPAQANGLTDVIGIAAGSNPLSGVTLALKRDGTVWMSGCLLPDSTSTPRRLVGLANIVAVGVDRTFGHAYALAADGTVAAWYTRDQAPTPVDGLSAITAISIGDGINAALKQDGTVWTWKSKAVPTQVIGLTGVTAVAAGSGHVLALTADGTVWAWGSNADGELGDGTTAGRTAPQPVIGLTAVARIAAGSSHSLALKIDGTVWAWGINDNGALGDGTYTRRLSPVVVLRELGAGTVAGNDWYLDLKPEISKTIPPEKIPAFLLVATGKTTTSLVELTADVQFRAQDIGRPIYVFGYAPASLVKHTASSKDDASCVLVQTDTSGHLTRVSASGVIPFGNNVIGSRTQAVNVLDNAPSGNVAGTTFYVGAGDGAINPGNNRCIATIPASVQCPCVDASAGAAANLPGALSGLWWNASESGWGIHFTQRRNIIFVAWYTYDASGNPKWYVASSCAMPAGTTGTTGTCNGSLYEVNGPTFFGAAFNSAAMNVLTAGSLKVDFQGTNNASLTYTAGGQTRTVPITRQPVASGTAPPAVDYTDLWWNPSESGWGMAITHQFNVMFLAWYVYDGSGKPVWYVASNCAVSGNGCSGTLYRTTGPSLGATFDASRVQSFAVGTVSVNFGDPNNAMLSYTVNGATSSKAITRQLF